MGAACRQSHAEGIPEWAADGELARAALQVRAAFVTMLGVWQLQLAEETEARLLPYLVAGLSDAQPEAAAAAAQALNALGALYEHEHAQELQVSAGLQPL